MIFPSSSRIANFHRGNLIQSAFVNALCHGLNYEPYNTGIENKLNGSLARMRKAIYSNLVNEETRANYEFLRKEPDNLIISPSCNVMSIEVKGYANITSLEDHLANNFRFSEMNNIISLYPLTRIVYVDVGNRKIASIFRLGELNQEEQRNNWEKPWTWIEGIENKEDYEVWSSCYIFESIFEAARYLTSLKKETEVLF